MSSTDRKGGCCGFPTSHVATTVALVYFFILTVLAAVARRQVGVLEEAATAEGSDEAMWTNPLIVSLGCAILFALFDLACIALLWLLSRSHDEPTTALKVTWAGTVFLAVVWTTFCAVGSYLSFGSIKTEIEAACTTLDTHCYPTYEGIQWASIVLEVLGLLLAGWMLVSTGSTVHPGFFHKTPSTYFNSRTSTSSRRKPRGDEEHGLLADGGASLRPTDSGGSAPYSLGRRAHSRSHGGSRRAIQAEEYSMRKPREPYDADPSDRGRSRDRDRTGTVARREIRRVQEEAERAVRSLGHARRVAERRAQEARKTASRYRSRGRRSSDEEREVRSMGKRGASRSRSRSRRSSSSEDSSSDDGRGRSRRSTSRGRSGSRRR